MIWIIPSEEYRLTDSLEKTIWFSAYQFWANSGAILGKLFLYFAFVLAKTPSNVNAVDKEQRKDSAG